MRTKNDEGGRQEFLAIPLTSAQKQVPKPGHGINIRADARAEFAAFDALDQVRPIGILSPYQIGPLNSNWPKNPFEEERIDVLPVS